MTTSVQSTTAYAVRRSSLMASMGHVFDTTQDDLHSLFPAQIPETFEPGQGLFWEGDPAEHVFEIVEGVMRVFRILSDGRRGITGFLFAGDLVGLAYRDKYLCSAEAVNRIRVRRATRERFHRLAAESPNVNAQLFAAVCDELSGMQDQVLLLAHKCAEERVAGFLLMMARRTGQSLTTRHELNLPMTRLDMADYLGLTIETVCRVFTRLKTDRVITATGRHSVVIDRPAALARFAGQDDPAISTASSASFVL